MPFHPNVNDTLTIDGVTYRFTEHPTLQGQPFHTSFRAVFGDQETGDRYAKGNVLNKLGVVAIGMIIPRQEPIFQRGMEEVKAQVDDPDQRAGLNVEHSVDLIAHQLAPHRWIVPRLIQ